MTVTKWCKRVGPGEYVPTVRCAECGDYIFLAPKLLTRWQRQKGTPREVAIAVVVPDALWVHIATLKEECVVRVRMARPKVEEG